MSEVITVTKPYIPPIEEYMFYLNKIWDNKILTNQGPLSNELENMIKSYLKVPFFQYVTNGTIALQLALASLDINEGEVITTPFSYVATASSILWQRCEPIFVDIEPRNFTIDVHKIERAITDKTKAIMPVHVFGYACDVEAIDRIAKKHNLKVIYDGAHAFASIYKGKSLLSYGDVSTVSFHATKLFHTVEGGGCIAGNETLDNVLKLKKMFGINLDSSICLGINAKQTEFNAAMGLALYSHIGYIIEQRKHISEIYDSYLENYVFRPFKQKDLIYNYAYYPVLFKNEQELLKVFNALKVKNIFIRRYFYPSLNTLSYLKTKTKCPISENVSSRIACLPLYPGLSEKIVEYISKVIITNIK